MLKGPGWGNVSSLTPSDAIKEFSNKKTIKDEEMRTCVEKIKRSDEEK